MARIAGVNIPTKKRVEIALTYIHGIGTTSAKSICTKAGVPDERRVNDLSEEELTRLRDIIDQEFLVEGDLRRQTSMNIKRYLDLGQGQDNALCSSRFDGVDRLQQEIPDR